MNKENRPNRSTAILSKALIVSYSYSGNTHKIAEVLHRIIGADWCEIYPWQPYPIEFPTLLKQVRTELKKGYLPPLLPGACSPAPYSIIFAGSPNWCGTLAPPLISWFSRNNLSEKIVLPFYSHCGGAAGDIRSDISRLCPKADVRQSLGILCGVEDLEETLCKWLKTSGIDFPL